MRRRRPCGCGPKEIVYPVKQNVVHCCSEEVVKHIHPSHTTVVNHHLVKNVHEYPHSTSVANTCNEVDIYGGSYQTTPPMGMGPGMAGPGSQVAGAMTPPGYGMPYPGGQVAGATAPGMGMNCHNGQVAGTQQMMNKGNKWC